MANAVIKNIQKLLNNIDFNAQPALIVGYGSIGKEIAKKLRDILKMRVTILDKDNDKLLEAVPEGFATERDSRNAVKDKSLIVGATGTLSIGRSELLAMEHNVYLVSASSDQREIGLHELRALCSENEEIPSGKKIGTKYIIQATNHVINLIADGYPINFWAEESIPNQVSDLIMTLIFLSAVDIAVNHDTLNIKINAKTVNELAKKWGISDLYLDFYHG